MRAFVYMCVCQLRCVCVCSLLIPLECFSCLCCSLCLSFYSLSVCVHLDASFQTLVPLPFVCPYAAHSDAPSPAEDHQQDVCRSFGPIVGVDDIAFDTEYVCGAVCETELYPPSATPSATESVTPSESPSPTSALQCPSGWTRYYDRDGAEGTDSCLVIVGGASGWGSANSSCPASSHLITIRGSRPSALYSIVFAMAMQAGGSVGLGCYQASTAIKRAAGWSWVDGTNASNLNCRGDLANGGNGCGIWSAIGPEPK